jgi:hypothetical protein
LSFKLELRRVMLGRGAHRRAAQRRGLHAVPPGPRRPSWNRRAPGLLVPGTSLGGLAGEAWSPAGDSRGMGPPADGAMRTRARTQQLARRTCEAACNGPRASAGSDGTVEAKLSLGRNARRVGF